jgi:hypothetical protein
MDRRFVRDGWLERLSREEVLLYFFLVAVADKDGLSYWGDVRVAGMLKLPREEIERAREGLVRQGILAYERPLYQVLDLAPRPAPSRGGEASSIAEILRRMASPGEDR